MPSQRPPLKVIPPPPTSASMKQALLPYSPCLGCKISKLLNSNKKKRSPETDLLAVLLKCWWDCFAHSMESIDLCDWLWTALVPGGCTCISGLSGFACVQQVTVNPSHPFLFTAVIHRLMVNTSTPGIEAAQTSQNILRVC